MTERGERKEKDMTDYDELKERHDDLFQRTAECYRNHSGLAAKLAEAERTVEALAVMPLVAAHNQKESLQASLTRAEADLERSRERTYAAEAALKEAVALLTEQAEDAHGMPLGRLERFDAFLARVSRAAGTEKP